MSPEAQRIAIAEACGWKEVRKAPRSFGAPPGTLIGTLSLGPVTLTLVPDYLNDLNAMHEAEELLSDKIDTKSGNGQCRAYAIEHLKERFNLSQFGLARASASQRSEALLRTIGKWDDAK